MIKPLRRLLYIIPIEDPNRMNDLIYLPEAYKQRCDHGIVKYRGPEVKDIRVGDHVVFHGYTGTRMFIQHEGVLFVMDELDIEAIVTKDKPIKVFVQSHIENLIHEACVQEIIRGNGHAEVIREIEQRILTRIEQDDIMTGAMF